MLNLTLQLFAFSIAAYIVFVLVPFIILGTSKRMQKYRIDDNQKVIDTKSFKYELTGTLNTFIIIGLTCVLGSYLYIKDLTLLKDEIRNPLLYILSIIAVILLHDAYFFFTHYYMHKNKTLYRFHLHHHKSVNPTAFSVFSFHPVEGIVHFIFFIGLCFLPIHTSVIFIFYIWMLLCNAFGHMNLELYSIRILKFKITRDFNTATHHYMHHKHFNSNFGIYYNHWDRLFNTNHKDYVKKFVQTRLKSKKLRIANKT